MKSHVVPLGAALAAAVAAVLFIGWANGDLGSRPPQPSLWSLAEQRYLDALHSVGPGPWRADDDPP